MSGTAFQKLDNLLSVTQSRAAKNPALASSENLEVVRSPSEKLNRIDGIFRSSPAATARGTRFSFSSLDTLGRLTEDGEGEDNDRTPTSTPAPAEQKGAASRSASFSTAHPFRCAADQGLTQAKQYGRDGVPAAGLASA